MKNITLITSSASLNFQNDPHSGSIQMWGNAGLIEYTASGHTFSNDITLSGNLVLNTAGKGITIKSGGTNPKCGTVSMISGAANITTTAYTTSSVMFFSLKTLVSSSFGIMPYVSSTSGSVVNVKTSGADFSTYKWMIVDFV